MIRIMNALLKYRLTSACYTYTCIMHEIKEWSQNFGADAALDNIHKQPPRTIHGLIMVPTYNHGCRSLFTNKTGLQIQV